MNKLDEIIGETVTDEENEYQNAHRFADALIEAIKEEIRKNCELTVNTLSYIGITPVITMSTSCNEIDSAYKTLKEDT